MNALEMRKAVLFHLNRSQSPRFNNDRITTALQIAEEDKISQTADRYKLAIRKQSSDSLEVVQKIKDELQTIVKITPIVIDASREFPLPNDYYYDMGLEVLINDVWKNVFPTSTNEKLGGSENIYERASLTDMYYNIFDGKGHLYNGEEGVNTYVTARMTYVRKIKPVFIDDEINAIPQNTPDLVVNSTYGVFTGSLTYNGVTYVKNESFVAVVGFLQFTGSGTALLIRNSELSYQSHKSLSKKAAASLAGVVENFDKNRFLEDKLQEE